MASLTPPTNYTSLSLAWLAGSGQGLTAGKMKECVWVRTDLVARIQFLGVDRRWSSETYEVRCAQRRQRPAKGGKGNIALNAQMPETPGRVPLGTDLSKRAPI
jgi:hypothetical protein